MSDNDATLHRIERVLASPGLTRNVVVAAAQALATLNGPPRTPDGDEAAMVARNALAHAFTDWAAVQEGLARIGLAVVVEPGVTVKREPS